MNFENKGGYWFFKYEIVNFFSLEFCFYFIMGEGVMMSIGIVIVYKSVFLLIVLESLWSVEKERVKKILGKDGLCF